MLKTCMEAAIFAVSMKPANTKAFFIFAILLSSVPEPSLSQSTYQLLNWQPCSQFPSIMQTYRGCNWIASSRDASAGSLAAVVSNPLEIKCTSPSCMLYVETEGPSCFITFSRMCKPVGISENECCVSSSSDSFFQSFPHILNAFPRWYDYQNEMVPMLYSEPGSSPSVSLSVRAYTFSSGNRSSVIVTDVARSGLIAPLRPRSILASSSVKVVFFERSLLAKPVGVTMNVDLNMYNYNLASNSCARQGNFWQDTDKPGIFAFDSYNS